MANKKFSEFVLKTSTSDVSHIVGYNGAENVQITPANFVTGGGTGVFLPLAGGTMTGNVLYQDSVQIQLGNSADLLIFHDGADSFIKDNGTGDLYIRGNDNIYIQDTSTERFITCNSNASVDLFHNDLVRLQTTSTGISVTGDGTFTGNVSLTSALPLLYLTNSTASTGKNWRLSSATNGKFFISEEGIVDAVTLDSTTGNATFAGIVKIEDTIELTDSGATRGKIELNASDRDDLDIKAISLGSNMKFFTVDTERMRLDASGNLGIGTSSPTTKLDVSAPEAAIKLTSTTGTNFTSIRTVNTGGTLYQGIERSTGGVLGLTGAYEAFLYYNADNPLLIGTANSYVRFSTNGAERMRLDSSGNLIVGATTVDAASSFSIQNTGVLRGVLVSGTVADTLINAISGISNGFQITNDASNNQNYKFHSNGGALSLIINSSGNVGVGTSTPFGKLSVNVTSGAPATSGNMTNALTVHNTDGGRAIQLGVDESAGLTFINSGYVNNAGIAQPIAFYTGGYERMRLDSSGNLLVGKSAANGAVVGAELRPNGQCVFTASGDNSLDLNRLTNDGGVALFRQANTVVGSISVTGSATAYNTSSDYRLKEDLQDFKGLDLVSKIPVYDYKWKADESRSYGVMAHELEEVLPQAVSGEKDAEEMQSVDYSKIVPLLVKSIQELSAKLEALECQCEKK